MNTVITANMDSETMMVILDIKSDCKAVQKIADSIKPICPYSEIGSHIYETEVYKACNECLPHAACPVPCGMVKAIEVAGGLGLKRNVTINIE